MLKFLLQIFLCAVLALSSAPALAMAQVEGLTASPEEITAWLIDRLSGAGASLVS